MLVDLYGKLYLDRFQEPATILWPRDMGIAKKLLGIHPFAKLAQWVREFIESDDKQITEGGRTFPQFQYHLSRIITRSSTSRTVKLLKGIYYDAEQTRTPIRDAVAFLAVNFQKMDMEAPTTRSYERALKDMAAEPEILQKAVELLIDEAANGRQFYPIPKPADLKGACAKVIEVLRLKAFCDAAGVCDHSPRFFEEITREDGSTELRRCSHWKIGKQAMEQIAKPLSLPAPRFESVIKEMV
jgi:hypothetical protein